jgi:hypothetical protein
MEYSYDLEVVAYSPKYTRQVYVRPAVFDIKPAIAAVQMQLERYPRTCPARKFAKSALEQLLEAKDKLAVGQEVEHFSAGASAGVLQSIADLLLDEDALVQLPLDDIAVLRRAHEAGEEIFAPPF